MIETLAKKVVGMTEEEAIKTIKDSGFISRILSKDRESFIVTMELRMNRINI